MVKPTQAHISELDLVCTFGKDAGHGCSWQATSVVLDPDSEGEYLPRCIGHEGLVDEDRKGTIVKIIPRALTGTIRR